MEENHPIAQPMTAKRQKILEKAFAQLRKSRAAMDPKILSRIRRFVASSPEIMKSLGLTESLKPDEDLPLSSKGLEKKSQETQKKLETKVSQKSPPRIKGNYEAVDQEKNMEVMAKLIALNPDKSEKIKSVIKKV